MYWRILVAIMLLVGSSYFLGKKLHGTPQPVASLATATAQMTTHAEQQSSDEPAEDISFAPSTTSMPAPAPVIETPIAVNVPPEPTKRYSLDLGQESQRIAAASGVFIGEILTTDKLPPNSPMAMTFRRRSCVLSINSALPLNRFVLNNLSEYGQRQLTFTLGHEMGHCYMLTHIARRDPAIIPSLSPPGKSYGFEQYVDMMGKYSEYPDLNRWNEEWADTFSAFILSKVYGKEFAMSVTSERFTMRKDQEKNGGVLMSNVYGGHGSLTEEAVFTIQSPLEIANLVKLGRLNNTR